MVVRYRLAKAEQLKEMGKLNEAKRELKDVVLSSELSQADLDVVCNGEA